MNLKSALVVLGVLIGFSVGADICLNGEWDFCFEEGKALEATMPRAFKATEKMCVPGCYDAVEKYRFKRGTGLYRRTFRTDKFVEEAWLVIEGMGLRGEFLLDGKSLGIHPYPYARLELATGPLCAGEHVLEVALDNHLDWKHLKLARPFYDFYFFGGFYRGVKLEFNRNQIFVRTRDIRTGEVEIEIVNRKGSDSLCEGEHRIVFDGKNEVKAIFAKGRVRVRVPSFKLWSPESPSLHTVAVAGIDAPRVRFGIRTVEAKNRKVLLNGKPIFLKGVNRHEQTRGKGVCMTEAEMVRDLEILKDLGANFIRGAHYQQNQRFLELCDERGFLVWEESLGWGNGHKYTSMSGIEELKDRTFCEQQRKQTREMVRASFNHPSVIIFAFLNECNGTLPECKELVDSLIKEIKEQDSGRLTSFACNLVAGDKCHENTDLVAFNAYPGTIPANPGLPAELRKKVANCFNEHVATFRTRYPEKPIMISESGCGGFYGMRDITAPFGCENFQDEYLTDIMDTLWANEDVVGFSIWQFSDTTTHQRNCDRWGGRLFGMSIAGIVNFDRQQKMSCETVKRYFKQK